MTRGQLPKAYLRIDPNIDQTHGDNLDGFIRLLCAANRQPRRGWFRSRAVLESVAGKAATRRFFSRGDVVDTPDGIQVPGWDNWQEGDLDVGERVRRFRARHALPTVTPTVTDAVTKPLPTSEASRRLGVKALRRPSDALGARDGLVHIDPGTATLLEELTGRHAGAAGDRQLTELDRLLEDHGPDVVQTALRTVADGRRMTARQLIWPVVKYLEPMANVPVESEPDADEVRAQLRQRKGASTHA